MHPTIPIALAAVLAMGAGCAAPDPDRGEPTQSERLSPAAPTAAPDTPPSPSVPTPAPATGTTHLALSGEGLDLVHEAGNIRHLAFGQPADGVIEAVARVRGSQPDHGRNEECGAGPLDMAMWPDALTVVSQDGRFVGWSTGGSARTDPVVTTVAGVGSGSTRRDLESAYTTVVRETTLGTEFEAGGLYGVLDGTGAGARITALWAGTTCVFR